LGYIFSLREKDKKGEEKGKKKTLERKHSFINMYDKFESP